MAALDHTPGHGEVRVHVLIATTGRPETLTRVVDHLSRQTLPASTIVVCPAKPEDVADGLGASLAPDVLHVRPGPIGAARQRNTALRFLFEERNMGEHDVLVAIDDDFLLRDDWLAECANVFFLRPDVVALTGTLADDGARNEGVPFDTGVALLAEGRFVLPVDDWRRTEGPIEILYGCNMAFRASAMHDLRFDEGLPLYSWLEDVDMAGRLLRKGRIERSARLVGVHLGEKKGRGPGRRFGYSQVVNNVYLMRKGTLPRSLGIKLIRDGVLSNVVRSMRPEPWIDRRGRLFGNLVAFKDLALGRVDPGRVVDL